MWRHCSRLLPQSVRATTEHVNHGSHKVVVGKMENVSVVNCAAAAGEVPFPETLEVAGEWEAHKALLRANPAPIIVRERNYCLRGGCGL